MAGVEVFVKLVLSSETDEEEFLSALNSIKKAGGKAIPVILQPLTPSSKMNLAPTGIQLLHWQKMALRILSSVRVIPQVHQHLNLF
jgi:organic radical activating enzyme